MLLGYQRLKRWLALLLATASKDVNLRPVMFAAVRRGLLMEELVGRRRGDEEMRNEVFICGVFSLLDRMFRRELRQAARLDPGARARVPGPGPDTGPYQPYLAMVRAAEGESVFEYREAAEQLLMSVAEINRAQLRALMGAGALGWPSGGRTVLVAIAGGHAGGWARARRATCSARVGRRDRRVQVRPPPAENAMRAVASSARPSHEHACAFVFESA